MAPIPTDSDNKIRHRGAGSLDSKLFSDKYMPSLREASMHVCWLLSQGYPIRASVKIVGERFKLVERQREAVLRIACSDQSRDQRLANKLTVSELAGRDLYIDGFNQLITLEAALSGAYLFVCRDTTIRDLSGIHGTYRRVSETLPAYQLITQTLTKLKPNSVTWLLDAPVGNASRLRDLIRSQSADLPYRSDVMLLFNPDRRLIDWEDGVISSDSMIINQTRSWFNLTEFIVQQNPPFLHIIDVLNQ